MQWSNQVTQSWKLYCNVLWYRLYFLQTVLYRLWYTVYYTLMIEVQSGLSPVLSARHSVCSAFTSLHWYYGIVWHLIWFIVVVYTVVCRCIAWCVCFVCCTVYILSSGALNSDNLATWCWQNIAPRVSKERRLLQINWLLPPPPSSSSSTSILNL